MRYKKYYIGTRDSDTYYAKDFFENKICLFSDMPSEEPFSVRQNQNLPNQDTFPYLQKKAEQTVAKNIRYMFYNPLTAYHYSENILDRTICLNSKELLEFLNNKLETKRWLQQNEIPVVSFETFYGKDIFLSVLAEHFKNVEKFVIQSCHGGGGIGTFLMTKSNFSQVSPLLQPLQQYIVSPFVKNISVNIHIFVSNKQTVLSPGSIQIIENKQEQLCYRGGDFIAFKSLPINIKNNIRNLSIKIANLLRKQGYKGIAGIDFLIDPNEHIYCSEINPRFQASTILLDHYMQTEKNSLAAKSCFELNEMAFDERMITTLNFESDIPYSCYFYYSEAVPSDYYHIKMQHLKNGNVEILEDGVMDYINKNAINEHSYLYRAVFSHPICARSPEGELWINNNIKIEKKPSDILALKIALLNQGIQISKNDSTIKQGVYEGIDVSIHANNIFDKELEVNCAYGIHLSKYSPFIIKLESTKEELFYYDEKIADVTIERNHLNDLPDFAQKILYLSTDRLRIKLISGCDNKNIGKGCEFCNVPMSEYHFTVTQITEALELLKKKRISFRHILIGGGTNLSITVWDDVIALCRYLKADPYFTDKPISLMSVLPPKEILQKLKQAGIDEVAFNLEVANETIGKKLMPAKYANGKKAYYEIFEEAVQIFGIGNVRTALLVGLDKNIDLYNEIMTLAGLGVLPCLSAFRALPQSGFENTMNPENEYLHSIYLKALTMLSQADNPIKELGPKCIHCRNNMLIV